MRHDKLATPAAACAAVLLVGLCANAAMGAVLASETFDNDFKIDGSGHDVGASGGVYRIAGTGANVSSHYEVVNPAAPGTAFTVSADISSDADPVGGFNVGLKIGSNNVVFHPGYTGGALRVDGTGGFGNQNVGFTPSQAVLHTLTVSGDGAGNFNLTLKDGTGVAADYTNSWTNAGNTASTIALRRSGPQTYSGMYDNFSVSGLPVHTFDNDFATQALSGGRVEAVGGVLEIQLAGTNTYTMPGHTGDLLVSGQIGSSPGTSNTNVGMRIGANDMVFHPGHTQGAFRVEGPGGFGNTNMGFTPAGGALHDMEVAVDAATGRFTIAVANADNPDNVYVGRFTNGGYSPGSDRIGFKYGSGAGGDEGRFDNYQVAELLKSTGGLPTWVSQIQAANPLHWYRLDETGSMIAIDSGSAAHHGVYQNGVALGATGLAGGAAQFDGVDDQIHLGLGNLGGPWTAEFLVEKTAVEPAGSLTRSGGYALRLDQWNNTGEVGFTEFGVSDYRFTPAVSVPLGEPTHLVYVGVPGTGVSAYINGQLVGTNSAYIPLPLSTIGAGDAFNGILDEAVFYDRALGRLEVLYHAGAAGFVVPEPATLLIWSLLAGLGIGAGARRRRRQE